MATVGVVVGRDTPQVEGVGKVTGLCEYAANLALPGMLHAKVARSGVPHARIVSVDTSRARAVPGVAAVLTAADLLARGWDIYYGPAVRDQPVLAHQRVRFAGEPVAVVVADHPRAAEEAADLVDVEYEELPAVFDALEAARPGAPVLHESIRPSGSFVDLKNLAAEQGSNVCLHYRLRTGDPRAAMEAADLVFDDTFTTPAVGHAPLEPCGCVALWQPDGRLVVHTGCQNPHYVRAELAHIFGLPEAGVRVQVPYLGGGFGAKMYVKTEAIAACAARACGRPVRFALSMDEMFVTDTKHAARIRLRTGVSRDGRLLARTCEIHWDTGAYAEIGPRIAQKTAYTASGPYRIPHVWIDSYCVYTNKPPAGAFRGFGIPQLIWAYESQMDLIARRLGMDPFEIRRRNALRDGDEHATGQVMQDFGYLQCLDALERRWREWPAPEPPPAGVLRGRGVACGLKMVLTPSVSTAIVQLTADGSATVYASTADMGQGSDTVLAMIAAERLTLPLSQVRVVHPDTDVTPYDTLTAASRSTYHMGNAILQAADEIRAQLRAIAARELEVRPDDLTFDGGALVVTGSPGTRLTIPEAMRRHFGAPQGSLVGRGECKPEYRPPDRETGRSDRLAAWWFAGGAIAEVDVEVETGRVSVRRLAVAADVGRALNPQAVRRQIVGGAVMQLGQTLFEGMAFDYGQVVNGSLADYRLPSFLDVPAEIEPLVVEVPVRDGPFGAKGVGESGTFCVSPAVANAVQDAAARGGLGAAWAAGAASGTGRFDGASWPGGSAPGSASLEVPGVRVYDLPLTPERVYEACRSAAEGAS
jgi:CO/xanthine dehydrogenase Mo-binding subunit